MKFVFFIFAIIIFSCVVFPQNKQVFFDIKPLISNRDSVEKEFGKAKGDCNCEYESPQFTLRIHYATKQCDEGWNIPPNTVLSVFFTSKKKMSVEDITKNENQFLIVTSDNLNRSYTDLKKGFRFFSDAYRNVDSFELIPTTSQGNDKALRCRNFPSYSPMNEIYIPSFNYTIGNWEDTAYYLTNIGISYDESENSNLFVFLYFSKNISKKQQAFWLKRVNKQFQYILKPNDKGVFVINGGRRKNSEIEAFILRKNYPPPTAKPIFK